jgi:4-hydroxybenzoate polyprenyltransferase
MGVLMDRAVDVVNAAAPAVPKPVPLVVDLDYGVLNTNSLIESLFVLARARPLSLLRLPGWWIRGRAFLQQQLSSLAVPNVHSLPRHVELANFLREQKRLGRPIVLATSADEKLARGLSGDSGLFDRVLASDGTVCLSGIRKRDRLIAEFGVKGFDYVGHHGRDLPVWEAARFGMLVGPSSLLRRQAAKVANIQKVFETQESHWQDYLRAMRPTHWVKNGLVFLPLAMSHQVLAIPVTMRIIIAFAAFNLCASGIYLLNDLLDLSDDREHPSKKERMLASGRIRIGNAIILMSLLLVGAFAIAVKLSLAFAGVLGLYAVLMVAYSMRLKGRPLIDVMVLSAGYCLRIAGGAVAVDIRHSAWLLTFSAFLFFSLALVKRYAELVLRGRCRGAPPLPTRGYVGSDKNLLMVQGLSSGYLAVVVLALYTNTAISRPLYSRHEWYWGVCVVLFYWVSYLWMAAERACIPGDPVMFALTDRGSGTAIVMMGLFAALAI